MAGNYHHGAGASLIGEAEDFEKNRFLPTACMDSRLRGNDKSRIDLHSIPLSRDANIRMTNKGISTVALSIKRCHSREGGNPFGLHTYLLAFSDLSDVKRVPTYLLFSHNLRYFTASYTSSESMPRFLLTLINSSVSIRGVFPAISLACTSAPCSTRNLVTSNSD